MHCGDGALMLVYLTRHGETDANKERRIQGALLDPPLNETGHIQATQLAKAIANMAEERQVHAVYASPALRARQTAEYICAALYLARVDFLPGLREVSWGDWDGSRVTAERDVELRAILGRWKEGDLTARSPGGESASEVITRAEATMRVLAHRHEDETIVIVGHERCNMLLLSYLLHGSVAQMDDLQQPNGGLTILREKAESWRRQIASSRAPTPDVGAMPALGAADAR